jgi:hypothetical protein
LNQQDITDCLFGILFAFLLVAPLVAQERTGRILGTVVDQDGNPIPGVTVTLLATAGAPMQAITSAEGTFRFLALPPSPHDMLLSPSWKVSKQKRKPESS